MEDNKLIPVLQQDWVRFECCKIRNAKVIWADHSLLADNSPESVASYYKSLVQENAYAIKDTPSFANIEFDLSDTKSLVAERYGGWGIGKNGGGGRCGNSGKYQLKGIGANCMVGSHDDEIHRDGGLDAVSAIIEIIYTHLLSILLPLGTVKIHGLILIGEKTAYYHHPTNLRWGTIMLRDNCLRPAHLMPAPLFEPRPEYESILINDVARIRKINKDLFKSFRGAGGFVHYLGQFLANCANQFGFARAARIMHGALSPSNITMSGQWFDLPLSTLLSGGINQSRSSDFYTEHSAPLNYATELLHGFSKYNGLQLNPAPLVNYYTEQFEAYFRLYIGFVLGILQFVDRLDSVKWKNLTQAFDAVIHRNGSLTIRLVVADDNDPVHALITAFFVSVYSPEAAEPILSSAKISEIDSQRVVTHSSDIMNTVWKSHQSEYPVKDASKDHFYIATALIALKRAYLATVFYSPLLTENVWDMCKFMRSPDDVSPLISSYIRLADWIFEKSNEQITLFQSDVMEIIYMQSDGTYRVERPGTNLSIYSCYEDLFVFLKTIHRKEFVINDFSFFDFFIKLDRVIPLMR